MTGKRFIDRVSRTRIDPPDDAPRSESKNRDAPDRRTYPPRLSNPFGVCFLLLDPDQCSRPDRIPSFPAIISLSLRGSLPGLVCLKKRSTSCARVTATANWLPSFTAPVAVTILSR